MGCEKSSRSHLWTVAARIDGLWCRAGLFRGASIRLTQNYQKFYGTLAWRDRTRELKGQINGTELRTPAGSNGELALQASDQTLRIESAQGNFAMAQGQSFQRAIGGGCSWQCRFGLRLLKPVTFERPSARSAQKVRSPKHPLCMT